MSYLRASLAAALRRILRRQWLVTFESQVSPHGSVELAGLPGVVIRRATADDSVALRPLLFGPDSVGRRLARGDVGLVAEMDGRLIGCVWIAGGPPRQAYHRVKFAPEPHERFAYGLYVLPEVRRRGVGLALMQAREIEARRAGASLVFSHVDAWNGAALALQAALGATPRDETFAIVLVDRFAVTLWRRRPPGTSHRPAVGRPPAEPANDIE
jgi:GNAT superfamily N-acetyltransferase